MTKFIELTGIDQRKFIINVDNIEGITVYNEETRIFMITADGSSGYRVKESYDEVKEKLRFIGAY